MRHTIPNEKKSCDGNSSSEKSENKKTEDIVYQSESNLFVGISSKDDLKKRYRDLLKIYHPDNQAGDTTMTQQIQEAYESLLQEKGWA